MSSTTQPSSLKDPQADQCPFSQEVLEMIVEKYHRAWLDGDAKSIFPLLLSSKRVRDLTLAQLYKEVVIEGFTPLTLFLTTPDPLSYLNIERITISSISFVNRTAPYLNSLAQALTKAMEGRTHRKWVELPGKSGFITGVEVISKEKYMLEVMTSLFQRAVFRMDMSDYGFHEETRVLAPRIELVIGDEQYYLEREGTNFNSDLRYDRRNFNNNHSWPLTTAYDLILSLWPAEAGELYLVKKAQWAGKYLRRITTVERLEEVTIDCKDQHFFCAKGPKSKLSDKLVLVGCAPGTCPYRDEKQPHPHPFTKQIDDVFRGEIPLPPRNVDEEEEDEDDL